MSSSSRSHTVAITGLGNIGSQLVPLMMRAPEIGHLILIDPDRYETGNRASQNISREDAGRPKVEVMAERIRSARDDITVTGYPQPVQDVPPALLRSDLMIGCVDSRAARQAINALAFRLGVPWIDGAVDGARGLGRVALYSPPGPCLECRWDDADYRSLETVYPCRPQRGAASTNAPAELGALVAAHQLICAREWLAGERAAVSREVFFSTRNRESTWARFARNPECRFDHSPITPGGRVPASQRIDRLPAAFADALAVVGHAFVHAVICADCHREHSIPPVLNRDFDPGCCATCGARQHVSGFAMRERLPIDRAHSAGRAAPTLTGLGIREGDILVVSDHGSTVCHLEVEGSS